MRKYFINIQLNVTKYVYRIPNCTYIVLCMFIGCFKHNMVLGASGGNFCSAALIECLIEWGK